MGSTFNPLKIFSNKPTKSNALIIYIDILGFSASVSSAVENNITSLLRVWLKIKNYYQKNSSVILNFFSDSLFIAYLVPSKTSINYKLSKLTQDLENVYDFYFDENFLIRGGIAYGEIHYNPNLLVGIPVIDAVYYESQINPGPFIIFPTKELAKIEHKELFGELKNPIELELKNNLGKMNCNIILPSDMSNFMLKIKELKTQYLTNGPYKFGAFWSSQYDLLIKIKNEGYG